MLVLGRESLDARDGTFFVLLLPLAVRYALFAPDTGGAVLLLPTAARIETASALSCVATLCNPVLACFSNCTV